jgi:hypothetical protein
MTAEVVTNEDTGKRRILTRLFRDEHIDISFVLDANQAEQWAAKMMFLAKQLRTKDPTEEVIPIWARTKRWFRRLK